MKTTLKQIIGKKPLNAQRCASLVIDSLISDEVTGSAILSHDEMIYLRDYQPKNSNEYNSYLDIYHKCIDTYHQLVRKYKDLNEIFLLIQQRHNVYSKGIQHIELLFLLDYELKENKKKLFELELTQAYFHKMISNEDIGLVYSHDFKHISLNDTKEGYLELLDTYKDTKKQFTSLLNELEGHIKDFPISFFITKAKILVEEMDLIETNILRKSNVLHNSFSEYTKHNDSRVIEYDGFMNLNEAV